MTAKPVQTVLVANRGEIAVRIIRSAREYGYRTVAVYATDDAGSPHAALADVAVALEATGPAAYLDASAIVAAARSAGADLVHPGYGFLSESAQFARECDAAGLAFVGPSPHLLEVFGDKAAARRAAVQAGVPVLDATEGGVDEAGVAEFLAAHPAGIMLKAVAGGGGRGMRPIHAAAEIADGYHICAGEAQTGFGNAALFAEELCAQARHIEVQVVGALGPDGQPVAMALGDRDCSVQRRHQKLIEIAPAQQLAQEVRVGLHRAAVALCGINRYQGLATVEFLVTDDRYVFLEVNPRIQVEHTITEEVTGLDLVAIGLAIANGATADDLALPDGIRWINGEVVGESAQALGVAIQARVNTETITAQGATVPDSGMLTVFSAPTGAGVRVDTYGRPGLQTNPRYDSLLAKVIGHSARGGFEVAARKVADALGEFVIAGVQTNIGLLRAILTDPRFVSAPATTSYLSEHVGELVSAAASNQPAVPDIPETVGPREQGGTAAEITVGAGEQVLTAPMAGVVIEIAEVGTGIGAGGGLAVLEAMKMQHSVTAEFDAQVTRILVPAGSSVSTGQALAVIVASADLVAGADDEDLDLDGIRADLAEIRERHEVTRDDARPEAVARRHRMGRRTARENIDDLVDKGSFVEYGALALAAQRTRRSEQDLIANTPADGLVAGVATIGADRVGAAAAEAVVISYDYTVLAGTQGMRNHAKTDRMIEIARRKSIPLVLFAEGGGGRPGDTDAHGAAGLELSTFREMAGLRGRVPTVAVVSGRCFAGNAALAGACDVLIATPDANIGMGGPAMVEGGGLGVFRPEQIGPIEVQTRNGVVHLAARDEADAVDLARRYLSYHQGDADDWVAPDVRLARHVVPENRLRAYEVRDAINSIADVGTVLELQHDYGRGVVTALIRVEGVTYGVLANSTAHLGGAIDAESADKAADFFTMCQSHGLPVVVLCDTPGFMVGPESEEQATVRRFSRLFAAGAALTVPFGTIILRKGYGLGAMAMAGGSFHAPEFTVAWPTGEIGPMGLEGAVRLGFRKELEAVSDPADREKLFAELLAKAYAHGKALQSATTFELDDVIDPAASRDWIRQLGRSRR